MSTILADPSNISWNGNTAKHEANSFMYRSMTYDLMQMKPSGKRLRVLSLPGPTAIWELGLEVTFPMLDFSFTGLERDEKVHARLARQLAGMPSHYKMTPQPCDFQQFAEEQTRRNKPYDVIYLDWMGTWSIEKKENISTLFAAEMLAPGGLLIITVSLGRGGRPTNDELYDLSDELPFAFYDARGQDKHVKSIKVRGIPHWIEVEAAIHNAVMRPIMGSIYYSEINTVRATPQLQIMMLREK